MATNEKVFFPGANTFRAIKTAPEALYIADATSEYSYKFEKDDHSPYFDIGNNMYSNRYVVAESGISQRFICENSILTRSVGSMSPVYTYNFGIYISTDNGSTWSPAPGANSTFNFNASLSSWSISSIFTDFFSPNVGDIIVIKILKTHGLSGTLVWTLSDGSIFSNSIA